MLIARQREKSGMCVLVSVRSLSRDTWSLQWRLKTQVSILLLPPPPDLTKEEGRKEKRGRVTFQSADEEGKDAEDSRSLEFDKQVPTKAF